MAAETITVYIDPSQLVAQKENNYSLFLAKMVNGQFTVIWQAMGPVATVNAPSYEYENTFQVAAPSYQVNYGTINTSQGSTTFAAAGRRQGVEPGQTVVLDQNGIFGAPTNDGMAGEIAINNQLQGNPSAALNDEAGNPIFVNVESGMDIGETTLTPVDTYQLWFDNYQQTGTIIAFNVGNSVTVTFGGGQTNQVISFNAEGEWQDGPLATSARVASQAVSGQSISGQAPVGGGPGVTGGGDLPQRPVGGDGDLSSEAAHRAFSPDLRPTQLRAQVGDSRLVAIFQAPFGLEAASGVDRYESSVNAALLLARADQDFRAPGPDVDTERVSPGGAFDGQRVRKYSLFDKCRRYDICRIDEISRSYSQ